MSETFKTALNVAFNIGFFGGFASLALMGVAAVWEAPITYRVGASGAVVCGVLFAVCFILALLFREPNKSTENEVDETT